MKSEEQTSDQSDSRDAAMLRPRLKLPHVMALVAILALAIWLGVMLKRSHDFRVLAAEQAEAEQLSMAYADEARGMNGDEQRVARGEQMAAYHRALKEKYDRAAGRPWLSVEPDPPEPEPPQ